MKWGKQSKIFWITLSPFTKLHAIPLNTPSVLRKNKPRVHDAGAVFIKRAVGF